MSGSDGKRVITAASSGFEPGAPLHRRAPSRDTAGRPLSDLMLLFPGLKQALPAVVERVCEELRLTLAAFGERVPFAELNLKLGLVWISVEADPGLCHQVAQTVRGRLPEARVVGSWLEGPPRRRLQGAPVGSGHSRLRFRIRSIKA